MCLIVVKPKGSKNSLTKEMFIRAATKNPHGIGILFSDSGKITIEKYPEPKDSLEKIYNKIADKDSYLIHFRYATHGKKDITNVHPFKVIDGLYMAHNGVLPVYPEVNKDYSDTRNFVEGELRPLFKKDGIGLLKDPDFIKYLTDTVGSYNKLVFVDSNMDFTIINENAGKWIDGCWYSNTTSIEEPKKYSYPLDNYNYNYNYDSYYNTLDDYKDYYDFKYTKKQILDDIAMSIYDGMTYGDYPLIWEFEYDEEAANKLDYEGITKALADISDDIMNEKTEGFQPFQWKLTYDENAFNKLIDKNNK